MDKEQLALRIKNRRTIGSLEEAQEKKAKEQLGLSDDSDDDEKDLEVDGKIKLDEGEKRGRKGRDQKLLGKRRSRADSDDDMEDVEAEARDGEMDRGVRGSKGKNARSMTPSQRKISVKKILRDRSASRREGSEPKRLEYKLVPEEHVRLAKKINTMWRHKIQRSEADREITTKKPKHLFAGKMSNGKKDYR